MSRILRAAVPVILAAAVLAPAAMAQGIESNRTPLRTTLAEIGTLRTEYVDAFNKKDAKALAGMYTANAVQVQADGTVLNGNAAISANAAKESATWPHAVIKSDTVYVYGATAVDIGTWTVHPKEGEEVVSRYITVLRHDMRGWKLANVVVVPTTK